MSEFCPKCAPKIGMEPEHLYEGEFCEECGIAGTSTKWQLFVRRSKNYIVSLIYKKSQSKKN